MGTNTGVLELQRGSYLRNGRKLFLFAPENTPFPTPGEPIFSRTGSYKLPGMSVSGFGIMGSWLGCPLVAHQDTLGSPPSFLCEDAHAARLRYPSLIRWFLSQRRLWGLVEGALRRPAGTRSTRWSSIVCGAKGFSDETAPTPGQLHEMSMNFKP